MSEKVIYDNSVVGYRVTEVDSDIGGKDLRFYYVGDKTNTVQFKIWLRDFTEIHDAIIDSIRRNLGEDFLAAQDRTD